jgi:AcrR family transcriptional regulator
MKEFILNKASEIFLKSGFKSVTMEYLSGELNISKKTIYKYFEDKEELVDKTVILLQNSFK